MRFSTSGPRRARPATNYPVQRRIGRLTAFRRPALTPTTFTPNRVGNVVATIDPRGNATTTQYDAMRRKTAEQNRNGGASALPLMAKQFIYDANGRLTTENRATGFDGSGNPTGWQAWLTAYTPTGKTAQTTDPLGHAPRTTYDALDRPIRVIDASGQVTGKTYDLAGEEIRQRLRIGSPNGVGRLVGDLQKASFCYYIDRLLLLRFWYPARCRSSTSCNCQDEHGRLDRLSRPLIRLSKAVIHLSSRCRKGVIRGVQKAGLSGFSWQKALPRVSKAVTREGVFHATVFEIVQKFPPRRPGEDRLSCAHGRARSDRAPASGFEAGSPGAPYTWTAAIRGHLFFAARSGCT